MRIPLLAYLSSVADAAPIAAAVVARRPVRGARAWVLVWCGLLFVEDGVLLALALRGTHNLWVPYVFNPIAAAVILWALSCWQVSDLARLTMRIAIVPLLAAWALLALAFDSASSFSRASDPLLYLVGLLAAASTLVARSRAASGEVLRQDWLWVSTGLALYLGTFSMIPPLSALFVGSDPVLVARAYQMEAVLSIAAFLAIARGVTCPATP